MPDSGEQKQAQVDRIYAHTVREGRIEPFVRSATDPFAHFSRIPGGVPLEYDAAQLQPHFFEADQLYHLEMDPGEQINLYGDEQFSDVRNELRALLQEFVRALPGDFGEFTPN